MVKKFLAFLVCFYPLLCFAGDVYVDGQTNDGHVIQNSGATISQQPVLNFKDGLIASNVSGKTTVTADTGYITATLDTVYLRLDASNDPMTGDVNMGTNDITGATQITAGDYVASSGGWFSAYEPGGGPEYAAYYHDGAGAVFSANNGNISLVAPTSNNVELAVGDTIGVNKVSIQDSTLAEVASIDSDGNADFGSGTVVTNGNITTTGTLTANIVSGDTVVQRGATLDTVYLELDGSNANTNINVGAYSFTTTDILSAGADADTAHILGRLRFGYIDPLWTDIGVISHYDRFNTTDFALAQDATGNTYLNTANFLYFLTNGANYFGRMYMAGGTDKTFHLNTDTTLAIGGAFGSERVEITQSGTNPTILDIDTDYSNLRIDLHGDMYVDDTMILSSGSITDSSGAISFGNENLYTTGIVSADTVIQNGATLDSVFLKLDASNDPMTGSIDMGTNDITNATQITATTFTGALTGNVTGNASGSSGSCTGNSATTSFMSGLSDPGANTIVGWDDTDNAHKFLTIGTGLTYTHASHTLSADAGSSDITSVGDVATGAAFDGTQGTTLTFNNAGGDGILSYDGTDFNIDKSFSLGVAGVRLSSDGDGTLTMLGLGNGFDESLTWNLDDKENMVFVSSDTGVSKIDFGSIILQGKFNSSDNVAGASATAGGFTFKDGLYTSGSGGSSLGDNTLFVGTGCIYTTIQAALDAAAAGDTILVAEGTYTEQITFGDDYVTLKALGSKENTTITQAADVLVNFGTKEGCVLEGFTLSVTAMHAYTDYAITGANGTSASVPNIVRNCKVISASSTAAIYSMLLTDGYWEFWNTEFVVNQTQVTANSNRILLCQTNLDSVKFHNCSLTINSTSNSTANEAPIQMKRGTLEMWNCKIYVDTDITTTGIARGIWFEGDEAAGTVDIYNTFIYVNSSSSAITRCLDIDGGSTVNTYNCTFKSTNTDNDGLWANVTAGDTLNVYGKVVITGALANAGTYNEVSPCRQKVVNITRVTDADSGDVAYTGVGFKPKTIQTIAACASSIYLGADDGTTKGTNGVYGTTPNYSSGTTTRCIYIVDSTGAKAQDAFVKTWDVDGFTLTWAETTGWSDTGYIIITASE